jgi:hypothetical protein
MIVTLCGEKFSKRWQMVEDLSSSAAEDYIADYRSFTMVRTLGRDEFGQMHIVTTKDKDK